MGAQAPTKISKGSIYCGRIGHKGLAEVSLLLVTSRFALLT